jgi:hypothetical protein
MWGTQNWTTPLQQPKRTSDRPFISTRPFSRVPSRFMSIRPSVMGPVMSSLPRVIVAIYEYTP